MNYAKAIGQPVLSVMGLFNGVFICNIQVPNAITTHPHHRCCAPGALTERDAGVHQTSQLVGNLLGSLILLFGGGDAATQILFYTLLAITLAR